MEGTISVNLQAKKDATLVFFWFGNLLPLTTPLIFLAIYDAINPTFTINNLWVIILMLMPTSVLGAYFLYSNKKFLWWTEKRVDFFLYAVAVATMITITYMVNKTGGFKYSILTFYFYFIPSAIAISFRAKWGLWITLGISFVSIVYNCSNKTVDSNPNLFAGYYNIFYIGKIFIHLLSIGLLERFKK